MAFLRHLGFAFTLALSLLLPACGGSIEPSTGAPGSPAAVGPACHERPRQSALGLDSCDVARESMTLVITGITWADPTLAWKQGGHARLEIRYQNASETDPIEYPGAVVTSSDPRAQTDSEAHGDPIVHPDLYALAPCMVYESRDHGFTLLSAVPTGTMLTFTVSPAVADGDDAISSCSGTLPTSVASFLAP